MRVGLDHVSRIPSQETPYVILCGKRTLFVPVSLRSPEPVPSLRYPHIKQKTDGA